MTPRPTRLFAAALLTLLVSVPATDVFAQNDDAVEKAAKLYKEGVEAYYAADYAVAITKYREGFQLDPNAMFPYGLSLCFAKLANYEEALEHAARADAIGGLPDKVAAINRGRVPAFATVVSAERVTLAVVEARDDTATCASDADCDAAQVCNLARGVCVAAPAPTPAPVATVEPLFGVPGWIGIGIGAVGLTATGIAAVVSAGLRGDIATYVELVAKNDPGASALRPSIVRRQRTGRVMLIAGIGGIAVGAGLVAYDLFFAGRDRQQAILYPEFSSDGVGVTWRAHF